MPILDSSHTHTQQKLGNGQYLMALVLVDRLDGHNLVRGQVFGPAHDPKRPIPNHIEVAKGKGHRSVLTVIRRHRHRLVPHLLH